MKKSILHKKELSQTKKDLEKKVQEGAKKALKDYANVFKRLAEYDREVTTKS